MVTSEQLAELHATIQRLQEEKVKLGIQADAKIQRLSDEKEALQNTCTKMQRKNVDSINEVARYTREIYEYKNRNEELSKALEDKELLLADAIPDAWKVKQELASLRIECNTLQKLRAWCRVCKVKRADYSNGKRKFYCEEHCPEE